MNAKLKNSLIGTALIVPFLALQGFHSDRDNPHQYRSAGPANAASADRTGSPLSGGQTCSGCHSSAGSFTNVLTSVNVRNSENEVVTSYSPGQTYTIELGITANGTPAGYGGQLTILDSDDAMAGDFTSTSTSNTQISTLNSVEYLEHSGLNSNGTLTASYTAPDQGTGTVTIYAVGLAANGSGNSGDNVSPAFTLDLTEEVSTNLEMVDFSNEVAVFPNPSTGTFNINLGEELSNVKTKLNTASGELIESDSYSSAEVLQLSINAPAGIYFYTIETESKSGTIRLIKK